MAKKFLMFNGKIVMNGSGKPIIIDSSDPPTTGETWVLNEILNPPASYTVIREENNGTFNYYDGSTISTLSMGVFQVYNLGGGFSVKMTDDETSKTQLSNYFENNIWKSHYSYTGKRETYEDYFWDSLTAAQKIVLRTVTFTTAPTGDLLTWLQANAVKQ